MLINTVMVDVIISIFFFYPNLKGWIPLKGFSVLIIPPVWYPDGSPPPNLKGWIPLRGFSVLIIPPVWYPDVPPPPNLKGWIPLRGLSVLIIPPVWYPDGSPPTQPKGLNPLEGFIRVDLSACMVPWVESPWRVYQWWSFRAVWYPDKPLLPLFPCSPPVPLIYKPKGWFLPCYPCSPVPPPFP